MKHLKTFENYSINEEEEIFKSMKKFFSGHGEESEFTISKENFLKELDEIEKEVEANPTKYVFNRVSIEKKAEENKYLGTIRRTVSKSPSSYGKTFFTYVPGKTGLQKVVSGSTSGRY